MGLLLDNWLLFDVERLLREGPAGDTTPILQVDVESGATCWELAKSAPIQAEALLRLLVDIATRDEFVTEQKFGSVWGEEHSPLLPLRDSGLVSFELIPTGSPDVRPLRERALDALCVTSELREQQARNEQRWGRDAKVEHSAHSVVIWGAAGYLARSDVLQMPYSGHPVRKAALEQTAFRTTRPDAADSTLTWIDAKRRQVFQTIGSNGQDVRLGATLPPIAVEVIESSSNLGDLIPTALQLREKYSGYRRWLSRYQEALESEDPLPIIEHRELLRSVEDHISEKLGKTADGETTVSISILWASLTLPAKRLGALRHRFGMRAVLNEMVFTRRGTHSLRKLIRMLGEERSSLGQEIIAHFEEGALNRR